VLILLEGCDGSGKTAAAGALRDVWLALGHPASSVEIMHKGPPDDPHGCPFLEYEVALDTEPLSSLVLAPDRLAVLDRWHIGDVVYGPRYRGFARYTPTGMLHTEMALSSLGAVKVLCSPSLEVVQDRVARDGDDYIDQADLPRIHAEYLEHGKKYGYAILEDGRRDGVLQQLLREASHRTEEARSLAVASFSTWTGSLDPAVIFCGDELGGGRARVSGRFLEYQRPFTPLSPGSSSEWLLDALLECGMMTTSALVNAHHPGVSLPALAERLPEARWVALGARASTALGGFGIEHRRAPHPAWSRRFRHSYHKEYAAQLAEAAGMEK